MNISTLTTDELANCLLERNISAEAVNKLKTEAIDGETFMSLNAALLHQMGIRMGPAIRLQQVIKHAKECCGIEEYTDHLRNRHVLLEPCSLRCNVGGCRRTFSAYKVLRQHIKKEHVHIPLVDSRQSINIDQQTNGNDRSFDDIEFLDACEEDFTNHSPPCIDEYGVSQAALKFIMSLASSSSVSLSTVEFVKNSAQELIKDILAYLKDRVVKTFNSFTSNANISCELNELLADFDGWSNPFRGIETQQQLLTYLKKKGVYKQAEPLCIGKRWEVRHNRLTNTRMQVEVEDIFYYVPIEDTVKLILRQADSWKMIDRRSESVENEIIDDWLCGSHGKDMQKYCQEEYSDTMPVFIQIYFDEVETVNPLGSKTGVHKLGAFYFVIKNFPASVNSSLQNIHLLALAHAEDLKKYNADAVMKVVVNELNHLHRTGFSVSYEMGQQHFRCFLTQVVGDNLGLHSLLGYVENFSRATFACDLCLATQDEIQTVFTECNLKLRTQETYNKHVNDLLAGKITMSESGIKRPSVLSSLSYYHPASNSSADIMHDLCEGVLPCETKLFVCHLLYEVKCITLKDINYRIKAADYGRCGTRSKPSSLLESHLKSADSSLGQRSAQMLMLFHWLPIILADVIELADPLKLRLFNLLGQIVEIVFAPTLTNTHLLYLQDIVAEHHGLFRICYPQKRLLYKHHRMVHYASVIRHSGPLLGMMVMRYEAKHNFAKRLAHIICNFKNISFSVAKRHQIAHALKWMTHSPVKGCAEVGNGEMISASELDDSQLLIPFIGSGVDIFAANSIDMFGQNYYPGVTVLTDLNEEGEPSFAAVDRIYVHEDTVYFVVVPWLIHEFSSATRAYGCTLDNQRLCVKATNIIDYKPFAATACSKLGCTYKHIILRHHLCCDRIYEMDGETAKQPVVNMDITTTNVPASADSLPAPLSSSVSLAIPTAATPLPSILPTASTMSLLLPTTPSVHSHSQHLTAMPSTPSSSHLSAPTQSERLPSYPSTPLQSSSAIPPASTPVSAAAVSQPSTPTSIRTRPGNDMEFDVRAILNSHQSGRLVIAEYDSSGLLLKRKQEMVHILVADMIDKTGNMYPSTELKVKLAVAIITAFPGLRSDGPLGYEHFFTPYKEVIVNGQKKKITPHGHIEERLKTVRKFEGVRARLPRAMKRVAPVEMDATAPFSTEERSMINELRLDDIGTERRLQIMEQTFDSRRKWVVNCRPMFTEFFNKFPPIKDMGVHFAKEFTRICPTAKDFLVQWEDMAPWVTKWATMKTNQMAHLILGELHKDGNPSLEREMEFALYLLPYIFQVPPRKSKRASNDEAAFHFIQVHAESSSIEEIMNKNQEANLKHPLVIVLGSRGSATQVFLTVEGQAVSIPQGVVSAVERLSKLYYMLNFEYADESRHILHFLQREVLGIADELSLSRAACDLAQFIRNKRVRN